LAEIRRAIQESPFHGEGHRKVWARLRVREVRTSITPTRRLLRLMRDNDLLAPQRQPRPVEPKRREGAIPAERPNPMWGIDATVGFTVAEGRVAIFAMVDHATAQCLGIPVAKRGTRFEALEPMHRAAHERLRRFAENIANGVRPWRDHGSRFMSDDFQSGIRFLGIQILFCLCSRTGRKRLRGALLPHPQGTAAPGAGFHHIEGAGRRGSKNPASGTTTAGCRKGSALNPRGRPVRGSLLSRLLHDDIQKTVQETGCGTLPKILSFEARQHLNIAEICLDLWVFPMQKQGRGGGFSSLNRQFHRPANGCLPRCLQR
jgi:hypothetical protein